MMWKCPKCGREFKNTNQDHYCGEKPKSIEEYILAQDEEKRSDLEEMQRILKTALPDAQERISWSMPTYWKKHNICHFAASKKHIGFYPGPEAVAAFAEELTDYSTDKGTIRIPYGKINAELIGRIAGWCNETGNHACRNEADNMFFGKKKKTMPEISFDPKKQKAVLKCSICNGEQVAGFKDMETGAFTEVMLIKSEKELELFKSQYGITSVTKEY